MDWDNPDEVTSLVERLRHVGAENEWIEFKENNAAPDKIGEYISALSNSAALNAQDAGFVLWGIRDADLAIVGTDFDPSRAKVGNEALVPWLLRMTEGAVDITFRGATIDGAKVVVLRIGAALQRPTRFKDRAFIRVDSYKKPLTDYPSLERRLWDTLSSSSFELRPALNGLAVERVIELIDYPAFFNLRREPLPENRSAILESLDAAGIVGHTVEGQWHITNAGALLYARDLAKFPQLSRKAPRVVQYEGTSRVRTRREQQGGRGYAAGFRGLIGYIVDLLPQSEVIEGGIRMDEHLIPELAIRELVANALIHQDLAVTGAGPMVEIFDDRIEITNPGVPLLDPQRFIDLAPRSRNERLGTELRMIGVCEERGSGWDKVAFEIEFHQLPPATVEVLGGQTRVSLFAPKPLGLMDRLERVLATYQHACLKYVSNQPMNNSTVRTRFGIAEQNKAQASRIIKDALEEGMIAPYDPTAGPRAIRYVPYWARPER